MLLLPPSDSRERAIIAAAGTSLKTIKQHTIYITAADSL